MAYEQEEIEKTYAEQEREKGNEIQISHLKEVFSKVDTNGDNHISFREFCLAVEELGIQWELGTAKTAFKTMDENGNKSLDWYEFSHGIHLVNPSVKAFWNNIFTPAGAVVQEEEDDQEVFTVEEMIECLCDKRSDWKRRNRILNYIPQYCENLETAEFQAFLEQMVEHIGLQLQERKSAVAREACLCVAMLGKTKTTEMLPFMERIFVPLFGAIRMNVKIIKESGKNAGRALTRFIPDDESNSLLNALTIGTNEKHKQVRARCYEYLGTLAEQEWAKERFYNDEEYWNSYMNVLVKGVGDRDAEARKAALTSIIRLKQQDMEDLYQNIEDTLDRTGKKRLARTEKAMS